MIVFDNGKRYVGQTVRLKRRVQAHLRGTQFPVSRAMQTHTWHVEILAECDDQDEIDLIERAAISAFRCLTPTGYNLETGGKKGQCSPHVSESNKRRRGVRRNLTAERRHELTQRLNTPEAVAQRAAKHTGMKRSPEARQRMSEAAKRRCTPEWCALQSARATQQVIRDPKTGQIRGQTRASCR